MSEGDHKLFDNMRSMVTLIDKLRDFNLHDYISLPWVAVLGEQSAGKSSLLETIAGITFLPRGTGIVTRRPLELRLVWSNIEIPMFEFPIELPGKKITDPQEATKAIEQLTEKIVGNGKQISNTPIVCRLSSQTVPDLTMIDLPGITRNPVGDQPANIEELTRGLAEEYCKGQETVILCVVPANIDSANSDALKLASQLDPKGERTLGVLTKVDLMDEGTDCSKTLMNEEVKLRHGYVAVKGRSQGDNQRGVGIHEALKKELDFFGKHPIYSTLPGEVLGTLSLIDKLSKLLYMRISQALPGIRREVGRKMQQVKKSLKSIGEAPPEQDDDKMELVFQLVWNFKDIFERELTGKFRGERIDQVMEKKQMEIKEVLLIELRKQTDLDEGIEEKLIQQNQQKHLEWFSKHADLFGKVEQDQINHVDITIQKQQPQKQNIHHQQPYKSSNQQLLIHQDKRINSIDTSNYKLAPPLYEPILLPQSKETLCFGLFQLFQELLSEYSVRNFKISSQYSDQEVLRSIEVYQGENIPGFQSFDSFLNLVFPKLELLRQPILKLLDDVTLLLEERGYEILENIFKMHPFVSLKVREAFQTTLQARKKFTYTILNNLLRSEENYLFTNDPILLDQPLPRDVNLSMQQLRVIELKQKLDAYFFLVVRNMRETVPKIIGKFLMIDLGSRLQVDVLNSLAKSDFCIKNIQEDKKILSQREELWREWRALSQAENLLISDFGMGVELLPELADIQQMSKELIDQDGKVIDEQLTKNIDKQQEQFLVRNQLVVDLEKEKILREFGLSTEQIQQKIHHNQSAKDMNLINQPLNKKQSLKQSQIIGRDNKNYLPQNFTQTNQNQFHTQNYHPQNSQDQTLNLTQISKVQKDSSPNTQLQWKSSIGQKPQRIDPKNQIQQHKSRIETNLDANGLAWSINLSSQKQSQITQSNQKQSQNQIDMNNSNQNQIINKNQNSQKIQTKSQINNLFGGSEEVIQNQKIQNNQQRKKTNLYLDFF